MNEETIFIIFYFAFRVKANLNHGHRCGAFTRLNPLNIYYYFHLIFKSSADSHPLAPSLPNYIHGVVPNRIREIGEARMLKSWQHTGRGAK